VRERAGGGYAGLRGWGCGLGLGLGLGVGVVAVGSECGCVDQVYIIYLLHKQINTRGIAGR
jgi:hypothetical protein